MDFTNIDRSEWGRLYPFESCYLDRGGLKYHYLDEGSGPPVVMVHGNPTWSFFYRDMIRALSDRCRVIVPDHIGCGLSDKPDALRYGYRYRDRAADLEALLDHLELNENVTLIVHDWGGAIGAACAVRRPDRIARLVVMNTAAFLPPAEKKLPWQLWIIRNLPFLAVPLVLGLNAFARGAVRMAAETKLPREVRAGYLAPYNSWRNRLATLKFVQDIPWREGDASYETLRETTAGLKRLIDKPMLLVWGEEDFVFDQTYLTHWQLFFPRAEVCSFSGAGHYLLEDAGDEIIPLVEEFLERTEKALR